MPEPSITLACDFQVHRRLLQFILALSELIFVRSEQQPQRTMAGRQTKSHPPTPTAPAPNYIHNV